MGKAFASALAALALCAGSAGAQPLCAGKPVRFIAGFVAGSATDTAARILAARLGPILGQQVIVENRPGASSFIATEAVASAAPDGCTLLFSSASATVNASAHDNAQTQAYKSLAPVAMVANVPNILVVHPLLGVKMQHVPYKGSSQAMNDVLSGLVPVMFSPASSVLAHIRAGKLVALATTSNRRTSLLDIPTMEEAGMPDFNLSIWFGVLAPKGTDASIVRRLAAAIEKAQDDPETRAQLATQSMEVVKAGPPEFGAFIEAEIARWGALIKSNNILIN